MSRPRPAPPARDLVGPPFPHQPTDRTTAGHPGSGPGEPAGRHIVGSFPGLSEPKVSMRTCRRKSSRSARDASPPRPSPTCPCSMPDCRTTSVPRWLRLTASCCCRGGRSSTRWTWSRSRSRVLLRGSCRRPPRAPIWCWPAGRIRRGPLGPAHRGHVTHAVIEHAASPVAVVAHDRPTAAQTNRPGRTRPGRLRCSRARGPMRAVSGVRYDRDRTGRVVENSMGN